MAIDTTQEINGSAVEAAAQSFNAHDLDGLADVLADDVVCRVPGGVQETGKAACVEFHRRWLADFPDAHVEVRARHVIDDVVVEEGTFRGTPRRRRAHRPVGLCRLRAGGPDPGRQARLAQPTFDRLLMLEQLGLA